MVLWVIVSLVLAAGVASSAWFANRKSSGRISQVAIRSVVGAVVTVLGIGAVLILQFLFAPGPRDQYSTWFMYRTAFWPGWVLLFSPLIIFGLSCSAAWLKNSRHHSLALGLLAVFVALSVQTSIWLDLVVPGYIVVQATAAVLFVFCISALSSMKNQGGSLA